MDRKQGYILFCILFVFFIFFIPFSFKKIVTTMTGTWERTTIISAVAGVLIAVVAGIWHRNARKKQSAETKKPDTGMKLLFLSLWSLELIIALVMIVLLLLGQLFGGAPDIH